ncbi:cyclin-dependent kinase inhibitor 1-like [Narcine bancroftii]|uniref:cyclin-dependent kinase inhibitor 1-like n=1 Tax=Narcine bancroftii TaxID=1343680 RepID=UPI0038321904
MDEATPFPCDQWRALIGKNRQVCRNLFGSVDWQQVQPALRDELRSSLEAARRRWAFDFKEERPVPGDLQWEAVPSQDVPSFYWPVSCIQQRQHLNPKEPAVGTEERTLSSKQSTSPLFNRKRKQALITDFYTLKRRLGPLGPELKP